MNWRPWVGALGLGLGLGSGGSAGQSFVTERCDQPSDCTGEAKFCVDGACVLTCLTDDECDPFGDHRFCIDGSCEICRDDTTCTRPSASVCDASTHACRGCQADSECDGGVCIDATGTCVLDQDVAFVSTGAVATACTRDQPCGTIAAAEAVLTGAKQVIHVLGPSFTDPNIIVTHAGAPLVIDGENTTWGDGVLAPLVIAEPADITIEGFSFVVPPPTSGDAGLTVSGAVTVTLFDVDIPTRAGKAMVVNGGATVTMSSSHIGTTKASTAMTIECSNATLVLERNQLDSITLADGHFCNLTGTHNRFNSVDAPAMDLTGALVTVENNVFVWESMITSGLTLTSSSDASVVRFNDLVDLGGFGSVGVTCDSSVVITSNIFAVRGSTPVVGCTPRYSVFDSQSTVPDGVGNIGSEFLFSDSAFHLANDSPAKGAAEPGQNIDDDFEGNARPNPAGTRSDSGAFEAP